MPSASALMGCRLCSLSTLTLPLTVCDIRSPTSLGTYSLGTSTTCKEKALRFLDEHKGITASSLFPDVEGLGRFLRWHLDSLLTTLL